MFHRSGDRRLGLHGNRSDPLALLQLDGHRSQFTLGHPNPVPRAVARQYRQSCLPALSFLLTRVSQPAAPSFCNTKDATLQFAFCSGMHIPHPQSHRVALVFYQTELKEEDDLPADTKL